MQYPYKQFVPIVNYDYRILEML